MPIYSRKKKKKKKGNDRQLLLDFLNFFYPEIKYTQEIEVHQQLNFLDLTICRITESLEYKIYRKPTSTDFVVEVVVYIFSDSRKLEPTEFTPSKTDLSI